MKGLLLFVLAAACIAGCDKGETIPAQVQLNPGGTPRTAEEQTRMDAHRLGGEKTNQEMAAAAQAMAAAKSRSGGK